MERMRNMERMRKEWRWKRSECHLNIKPIRTVSVGAFTGQTPYNYASIYLTGQTPYSYVGRYLTDQTHLNYVGRCLTGQDPQKYVGRFLTGQAPLNCVGRCLTDEALTTTSVDASPVKPLSTM